MKDIFFETPNAFIFGYGMNEPYSWVAAPFFAFALLWALSKLVAWVFGPESRKRSVNESLWEVGFFLILLLGFAWYFGNTPEVITYTEAIATTVGVAAWYWWLHRKQSA